MGLRGQWHAGQPKYGICVDTGFVTIQQHTITLHDGRGYTTVQTTITTAAAATHIKKVKQSMDVRPRKKKDGKGHSIHPYLSLQLHAGHHLAMHLREEQWVWQWAEVLLQEAGAVNDVHTGREAVPCIQQFLDTWKIGMQY